MFAFLTAFIISLITLYAPGYLIGRTFSLAKTSALALAPAFGIAPIVAIGVVLYELNISCPAPCLLALALLLSLIMFAAGTAIQNRKRSRRIAECLRKDTSELFTFESPSFLWRSFILYILISLIVCAFVFLVSIDGLDSFARKDDTTVHLSIVRAFIETGTYSTLHSTSFLGQGTEGSYYPSAWHIVVAIAASFIGNSVTIATNAVTLSFTAVVLPLGFCLLLSAALPEKRRVILAGSLFATTFAILPWGFLTKGQLLPNMASYSLIPATIALLITAIETSGKAIRVKMGIGIAWCIVSIALCQPNGAFTCVIGMASYAICRIFRGPNDARASFNAKTIVGALVLLVAACAAWAALFVAPPLQAVVTYGQWDTLLSLPEALASGLSFMYVKWGGIQPVLSLIVLTGVIATIRERKYLWFTVAYLITFIIYLGNMTLEGFPRQLIAGFWYADYYRTAAMNALFAVPLAALGLAWLIRLIETAFSHIPKLRSNAAACNYLAIASFAVVFIICQTVTFSFSVGGFKIENGLMTMRQQIYNLYTWDSVYTDEERAFVQKAESLIENDSTVVNIPNDGTAWSYGTDGIHVLFRRTGDNGSNPFPSKVNKIIREHLDEISSDPEVRQAVESVDAEYVILLDDPSGDSPTMESLRYEKEKWTGVESITPDTPGFELLLSEGDMRFYKITAVAD